MSEPYTIKGTKRVRTRGGRPPTSPPGRVCVVDWCDTRLSVYNKTDRCWEHRQKKAPRLRGRTQKERSSLLPKCRRCSSALGRLVSEVADSLERVELDGSLHWSGVDGGATLCDR